MPSRTKRSITWWYCANFFILLAESDSLICLLTGRYHKFFDVVRPDLEAASDQKPLTLSDSISRRDRHVKLLHAIETELHPEGKQGGTQIPMKHSTLQLHTDRKM